MDTDKAYQEIGQIISIGFGGVPEAIVDARVNPDSSISGEFVNGDDVYSYRLHSEGIEYQRNDSLSNDWQDYWQARLDAENIDYSDSNPYEYFKGYYGIRSDAVAMKCQFGQCGGRCLRRGEKCNIGKSAVGHVGKALKSVANGFGDNYNAATEHQKNIFNARSELSKKVKAAGGDRQKIKQARQEFKEKVSTSSKEHGANSVRANLYALGGGLAGAAVGGPVGLSAGAIAGGHAGMAHSRRIRERKKRAS